MAICCAGEWKVRPAVPVPYADSDQLKTLYLMAQVASPLADIRDFFPAGSATRSR
jgi:hypothetical protein